MPTAPALDRDATRSDRLELTLGIKSISRSEKQATVAPDGTEIPEDALYIEGYASTPDVDRYGEIVAADAFKKGIKNYLKNPIVLFAHDDEQPIGVCVELEVTDEGCRVRCAVVNEEKKALIKAGVLRAFSIGFLVKKYVMDTETEVPTITELELVEISVVAVPANQEALFQPKAVMLRAFKSWMAHRSADPTTPNPDMPPEREQRDAAQPDTTATEPTEEQADEAVSEEGADNEDTAASEEQADDSTETVADAAAEDTDTDDADEQPDDAVTPASDRAASIAAIKDLLAEDAPDAPTEADEAPQPDAAMERRIDAVRAAFDADIDALVDVVATLAAQVDGLRSRVKAQDELLAKLPAKKALVATPQRMLADGEQPADAPTPSLRQALLSLKRAA